MDLIKKIHIPTLIVNKSICRENIRVMKKKAVSARVLFRPHFKTHQSEEIAGLFSDQGINKICVSSVSMAWQFAASGWHDITIAFPFNIREIDKLHRLVRKARISILIENPDTASFLNKNIRMAVQYFIETDNGYHRSGIETNEIQKIQKILELIDNPLLSFSGFLSHFGNTYQAASTGEIRSIYKSGLQQLNKLKSYFLLQYPGLLLSIGDTPSASLLTHFEGADEIRPGNFVYYDVFQHHLGACSLQQIAVVVACPVVSVKKHRSEVVIYGGAAHLSKEFITGKNGEISFGTAALFNPDGSILEIFENARVKTLSQEHGIISFSGGLPEQIHTGTIIGILPVHSCLTANLLKKNTVFIN